MADPRRIDSTRRWRNGLALAAVIVPVGCSALFARQAQRLDALARDGRSTAAEVTSIDGRGTTFYRYTVDGQEHTWNVARAAAPFRVGESFTVTYLPSDPSLSRPVATPAGVATEAAGNRRFARNVAIGEVLFFGLFAAMAHRDLGRLRAGVNPLDPEVYRERLRETLAFVGLLVMAVSVAHGVDARAKGESLIPVVVGALLSVAVLGGTVGFVTRQGPAAVAGRSAKILRWVVPAGVVIALLRVLALRVAGR